VIPLALLLVAWTVQFGPDTLEAAGWDYFAAQTIIEGAEVAMLWAMLALWLSAQPVGRDLHQRAGAWCGRWACWWCCIEGLERAGCRLAFDVHKPMPDSTVNVCDLATGLHMTWASVSAAVLLACLAIESTRR
jgi:hypothetical protein